MLRQRVLTALVLVAFLLGSLLSAQAWPFALLTLALMAAGGWEWGRLNQASPALALAMGAAVAVGGAAAYAAGWHMQEPSLLWWLVLAWWTAGASFWVRASFCASLGSKPRRWTLRPTACAPTARRRSSWRWMA